MDYTVKRTISIIHNYPDKMKKIYFFTGICILLILVSPIIGNTQTSIEKNITGEALSIQIDKKDASGENISDGYIHIKIMGGAAPYGIRCIGPKTNLNITDKNKVEINNLGKGEYLIIARDNSGNIKYQTLEIK
jgi:hypothetical protein